MLVAMQDSAGQPAANDTHYLPPRHRTLPILASITPIANYPGKLRTFLTNASRCWQVRCFLKGRPYTQSLKTTNKQAAISLAFDALNLGHNRPPVVVFPICSLIIIGGFMHEVQHGIMNDVHQNQTAMKGLA